MNATNNKGKTALLTKKKTQTFKKPNGPEPLLEIKQLVKFYDTKQVLKGTSFKIYPNSFVSILGPSGCGKTTTLRILGGFETPTSGQILFKGKNLLKIPPNKRPINTVFQNYALFPHLNIYENIAFGLRTKRANRHLSEKELNKYHIELDKAKIALKKAKEIPTTSDRLAELKKEYLKQKNNKELKIEIKKEKNKLYNHKLKEVNKAKEGIYFAKDLFIGAQVKKWLTILKIDEHKWKKPHEVSGGQQQRVALARSLINEPEILLLDEPLSALDAKLRKEMQLELKKMQRETKVTFIYITHDQEEAMTMSDSVIVMSEGKIQQHASPYEIYDEPANKWVAKFIGDSNILDSIGYKNKVLINNKFWVKFEGSVKPFIEKTPVDLCIRPEDINIVTKGHGLFNGIIKEKVFKGQDWKYTIEVGDKKWYAIEFKDHKLESEVGLDFDPIAIHPMKKPKHLVLVPPTNSKSK